MNLVSGELYWTKIDSVPNKYTYLSEDIKCDVAIIGAGITGALCAYYFAKAGINAVVFEKNIIGYGSTSTSTSILQYEIDTNLIGLTKLVGLDNAVSAFKLCHKGVYDIEAIINDLEDKCDFILGDCLYYTNKSSDISMLQHEVEVRKEYGFDVEYLDEKQAKDRFSFPIKAGIYSRSGVGGINPYRFTHALIDYAVKRGVVVYENTEVLNTYADKNEEILITSNGFKIRANKVLIAEGYEGRRYIDKSIATFTRSFTLVTKPVKDFIGWYNKCIIRDTSKNYTYLRVTADNRIMIGGEDIDVGGERSKVANLCNEDSVAKEKYKLLEDKLRSLFPKIRDIEIEYRFSGLFGDTKDGLPYIGRYNDLPNYYFCMGYGSNGILYNVIGAQLLRDLHLGKKPQELNIFTFDR